ncbi:translation initiation factor IF-2 subunit gamma [Methanonatronarchaeum sp. AMET6-2]|uniref:translation initiation factor IF-2 subunit gamma n=1 Tax=Methanonatronarchaeum sp. AMET6-2 TaxID=2933293 RepID=UPI001FF18425|nr:translation initiation factor IF-2 subunit gamma [Methanonatronarchaeum sp. AMET6-2]UOY09516.1 translation initiation factor IF-2 subunit gamma [Methanonatronarchaeum sp. AMET6-2]
MKQPEVNIGLIGHVDHGKTTLVEALSGTWTDQHSEELRRGISIRLGYADTVFKRCSDCEPPEAYTTEDECECGGETEVSRAISFVDAPGHETLMATMLSGSAIMDGAVLVIAANEECPQPQTKEHLMALDIIGVEDIVVVQNKIDLVSKEEARENYRQIKEFVKGTVAEDAPIIPCSAQQRTNIDMVITAIEEVIPTPARDLDMPVLMPIARSFDVNKPGTEIDNIKGGIIGGSIKQGSISSGTEIEIRPGKKVESGGKTWWEPILTETVSIFSGGEYRDEITPGGLVGIGTKLDPFMTKSDGLVGQIMGLPEKLPPVWNEFVVEVDLLDRVVGVEDESEVEGLRTNEPLMLNLGTATTVGVITSARENEAEVKLKRPVCAEEGSNMAISRRIGARWRLIGVGKLKKPG